MSTEATMKAIGGRASARHTISIYYEVFYLLFPLIQILFTHFRRFTTKGDTNAGITYLQIIYYLILNCPPNTHY